MSLAADAPAAMESDRYPYPTRPAVTAVMKGNRKTDTRPEVALRSALHRSGARFRKNHNVKVDEGRAIRVDIVFPRAKLAVLVDGCFWHRCPEHGVDPRSNTAYWSPKLMRNVERDRVTDLRLRVGGWTVLRVWEHEVTPSKMARTVEAVQGSLARRGPGFLNRESRSMTAGQV